MTDPAARRRVFFALWPDDAGRRELVRATAPLLIDAGGRPIARSNLHLTLLYIGSIEEDARQALEAAVAGIGAGPVTVWLEHLGHWARPQVAWSGPRETSPPLARLVRGLRAAARASGLTVESRRFAPHVTLRRKVRLAPAAGGHRPVVWRFARFHLIESVPRPGGVEYRPLADWSLACDSTLARAREPGPTL